MTGERAAALAVLCEYIKLTKPRHGTRERNAEVGAGTASCSRPRRPQLSKMTLGSEEVRPPTALK